MKIETKFNIGDKVIFAQNSKLLEATVHSITIGEITKDVRINYSIINSGREYYTRINNDVDIISPYFIQQKLFPEEELFKTKEELIASL